MMKNNLKFKTLKIAAAVVSLCSFSMAYGQVTEPAQAPLFTQVQVPPPNIMLSFDNSGSMASMAAPDDLEYKVFGTYFMGSFHPEDRTRTSNIGILNTGVRVVSTNTDSIAAVMGRNALINPVYYNPAIRYRPWRQADGSFMPWMDNPRSVPVRIIANTAGQRFDAVPIVPNSRVDLVDPVNFNANGTTLYCDGVLSGNTFNPRCVSNGLSFTLEPGSYFIYRGTGIEAEFFDNRYNLAANSHLRNTANYQRIVIRDIPDAGLNLTALFAGYHSSLKIDRLPLDPSNPEKNDCELIGGNIICSKDAEFVNFANWYAYYRGRTRTAIASLSEVFSKDFGMEYRLGWGDYSTYLTQYVRDYAGAHREQLYKWLYSQEYRATTGTPTPAALNAIGNYYTSADPWKARPGDSTDVSPPLACRKSYAIVMTDGAYGGSGSRGNADGLVGGVHYRPDGSSYQYQPVPPFQDNHSNTLADVAMHYWKTDLLPSLPNLVPESAEDNAFWQHMTTHTIGFGVKGTLDPRTDFPAIQAGTLQWPYPNSDLTKFDDLWHAAVNGHGTYASASDPSELVRSLSAIMENMSVQNIPSAYSVTANDYLEDSNRAFVPNYVTGRWTGELTSHKVKLSDGSPGEVLWRASSLIPAPSDRNIWIGKLKSDLGGSSSAKYPDGTLKFTWGDVQNVESIKSVLPNEGLVNYLRGDETSAVANGYRERPKDTGGRPILLGDIVNSKPVYVGAGVSAGYSALKGLTPGKIQYNNFHREKAGRTPMVFVGANDGMLHGFDATTGVEKFAYIPAGVVQNLPLLASPLYETEHRYYVDGPLNLVDGVLDTCSNYPDDTACWGRVLLGSAGAGAKSVFALNVTDPDVYTRADNPISPVMWELTPESPGMEHLGNVLQPLQAGIAANGQWVAIFGNGAHSKTNVGSLYIVDLKTGEFIRRIEVSQGLGSTGMTGLMGVSLILNENKVIVGAYAGDLRGNIWRFDLSNADENQWRSYYTANGAGMGAAKPFFTTENGRPIYQAPQFEEFPQQATVGPNKNYMVVFGTGKYFDLDDRYETAVDALYGIRDNGNATVSYSSNDILKREVEEVRLNGKVYYNLKNKGTLNWDSYKGWSLPLTFGNRQRSLYSPTISGGNALFSTVFTGTGASGVDQCVVKGLEYGLLAVNLYTGGLPSVKFDTNNDGVIDSNDQLFIGGGANMPSPGRVVLSPNLDASDGTNIVCKPGEIYGGIGTMGIVCHKSNDNTSWSQLF